MTQIYMISADLLRSIPVGNYIGSLRYCGVSLPVILELWILAYGNRFRAEPVLREAIQNVKQLMSPVTPQYLKEPILVKIKFKYKVGIEGCQVLSGKSAMTDACHA